MSNEILFIGHSSGNKIRLGKRFGGAYNINVRIEDLQEFFSNCAFSQALDDFTLFGEWTCEQWESKIFPLMGEEEFETKCKVKNFEEENIVVGNVWVALDNLYKVNPTCNCKNCGNQYSFTEGLKSFKDRIAYMNCPKCNKGEFDLFTVAKGSV